MRLHGIGIGTSVDASGSVSATISMSMDYLRDEFDFVIIVSHLQTMREQTDQQININIEKKTGGEFGVSSIQYPNKK